MSQPQASEALAARPPTSAANASATSARWSWATISSSLKTTRSAARAVCAWTPQPMKPTLFEPGRARCFAATPAAAPVRAAVSQVASITASGRAVAGSLRMYIPRTVGRPCRDGFSGWELTHFTPAEPGA